MVTRNILERVFTLTKQTNEQQLSSSLTVPLWTKPLRNSSSGYSDTTVFNQSPRSVANAIGPIKRFDFSRAQRLIQTELTRRCAKISKIVRYEPKHSIEFARDLAQQLRRVLKSDQLNSARYKTVVLVSVVQTLPNRQIHQSTLIVSRCLWDRDTDGSITVQTKFGHDMIAIATVFAVYTE